ncbi:TPA: recombinase family protein [Klebsiella pneumoniae]|uniref:recombinase family protein n=1 Tax=Klebsiella/Raoultella group TaxID=2890311 RepID=UPI000CC196F5|nr:MULTISPECIES: recombinase family protein [Klebsiella/Raoultella group]HCI6178932.1 recombinase family protein [Klebsiella quasipneumoniae subsp. quasipneumoniae]HDS9342491.1 recombinase family protein [Klebsiella pneumoniae subsp. pneumoniae]HDT6052954.1 recombinase family protein [Klebsiella michiganensis]AXO53790.1 recombinase family protein [Klebsiella pneumoniae]EKW3953062.1 recombinase family protein [Klebsiella pneumoniae]
MKQNGQAYSYIRFSSKKQEQGDSVRRQTELAEQYAHANSLILSDKNFQDLGISAFKEGNRPSLGDMLEAIEKGQIEQGSTIIIESLDRLSRRGIDVTQQIIKSILQNNVFIASLVDGLLLNRESTNDLVSVIRIALAADLAYKESEKKSQRLRETKGQQRQRALNGEVINKILPFWLERKQNKFVFSEKLDTVKRIIELRRKGLGTNKIAKTLNNEGHKPLRSAGWNHTTVGKTINSVALYGAYQTSETTKDRKVILLDIVEDYYPAVISKEEFMLLQSDQKQNKPGYKSEHNAFTGILKHECGGALVRKFHVVSGKTYQYHVCANARDGKCNVTKNFKNIEIALYQIMKELKLEKKTSIDETLLLERNSVKAKIQELNDMLLNVSKIPISVIQTINNLEEKQHGLEENIKQQNNMIISEQAFDFNLLQEIKDPQELNMMLKRVIEQIIVFNIGKRWRVKVMYRNKHSQSFIWDGEKISFISDTKKLLELFKSQTEEV